MHTTPEPRLVNHSPPTSKWDCPEGSRRGTPNLASRSCNALEQPAHAVDHRSQHGGEGGGGGRERETLSRGNEEDEGERSKTRYRREAPAGDPMEDCTSQHHWTHERPIDSPSNFSVDLACKNIHFSLAGARPAREESSQTEVESHKGYRARYITFSHGWYSFWCESDTHVAVSNICIQGSPLSSSTGWGNEPAKEKWRGGRGGVKNDDQQEGYRRWSVSNTNDATRVGARLRATGCGQLYPTG
eukprot:2059799-Pyramimonas_sp.AAC.2